jgi:hypothetical protein
MSYRWSRLGRNVGVIFALALLGGQQASAAWICLPPPPCPVIWLFGLGMLGGGIQELQSRMALTPSDQSDKEFPPLCLTEAAPVSVWAEVSRSKVTVGQTFDVKIFADFSDPIISFGFHFEYDSALVALENIHLAPAFSSLQSNYADGVAALAYPNVAEGNRVLLATGHFRARTAGAGDIGVDVTSGDSTEGFALAGCGQAEANFTSDSVTIKDREPPTKPKPPVVPEPTSMVCLLAGLGLLRGRGRAR